MRIKGGSLLVATIDYALGQSVGAQVALDEFVDFPAAFADQGDHVYVGGRVAGHHSQEHGLSHPGAGENPHSLPFAAGYQAVDRTHSRGKRVANSRPVAGMRRAPVERSAVVQHGLRLIVYGVSLGVQYAAQHLGADAQPARGPSQSHAIAMADAL